MNTGIVQTCANNLGKLFVTETRQQNNSAVFPTYQGHRILLSDNHHGMTSPSIRYIHLQSYGKTIGLHGTGNEHGFKYCFDNPDCSGKAV